MQSTLETRDMKDWSEGESSDGIEGLAAGEELHNTQESHTTMSSEDPMSLA